ncbi:PhzF family phenazine biosynthesis protein [Paraglaciecola sp.]|uniref:PhzF family phenazine biosynthesis protein n=1 Tax=Paraglaciecola sp. TaxID=1920173 RepID=UPI003EF2D120
MQLPIYQVDAFATKVFEGNPAAVCPLNEWLSDELLQKIAQENNLSETAFFVQQENGYQLRWFTPNAEVDLCGHATLAAAHVLFQHLGYSKSEIVFTTRSGDLVVSKYSFEYVMDFPADVPEPIEPPTSLLSGLGLESASEILAAYDFIVVLKDEKAVHQVKPDFNLLKSLDLRGVVITAKGDDTDFVSRCFFPKLDVNEDPVTGSAHCELTPYWAKQLNKNQLTAKQLSPRTGQIKCELQKNRVKLAGQAVDYMQGEISI